MSLVKRTMTALLSTAALTLIVSGAVVYAPSASIESSTIPAAARAEYLVRSMSISDKIGQLFFVDLRRVGSEPVHAVTEEVKELFERYRPGGVLLFGENIDTVDQTRNLIAGLGELSVYPLAVATDYEGGVVSRLTSSGKIPATRIPASREVGANGDTETAYQIGRIMGRELGVLGVTMNFAPVADVVANSDSMIGSRSYSEDPKIAAQMVRAVVSGLQDSGISSVAKHFPGHGNVAGDTHDDLVELDRSKAELKSLEFVPFEAAIESGVDGIMTAHIVVPEITGDKLPATFSYEMISGLLRGELGHAGLIITDSLTMRAIRNRWDSGESAVRALRAGADIILHPLDVESAFEAVAEAVETGSLSEERIDESVRRVLFTKLKRDRRPLLALDPEEVLGNAEHRSLVETVAPRSSKGDSDGAHPPDDR